MSADRDLVGVPELGDRVADKVTGWRGLAVAETRQLFGGRRLTVESEDKNDITKDAITFDATRLVVVAKGVMGLDK